MIGDLLKILRDAREYLREDRSNDYVYWIGQQQTEICEWVQVYVIQPKRQNFDQMISFLLRIA